MIRAAAGKGGRLAALTVRHAGIEGRLERVRGEREHGQFSVATELRHFVIVGQRDDVEGEVIALEALEPTVEQGGKKFAVSTGARGIGCSPGTRCPGGIPFRCLPGDDENLPIFW